MQSFGGEIGCTDVARAAEDLHGRVFRVFRVFANCNFAFYNAERVHQLWCLSMDGLWWFCFAGGDSPSGELRNAAGNRRAKNWFPLEEGNW